MDDHALWDAVVQTVRPLKSRHIIRDAHGPASKTAEVRDTASKKKTAKVIRTPQPPAAPPLPLRQANPIAIGKPVGVDRRTADRLRRPP